MKPRSSLFVALLAVAIPAAAQEAPAPAQPQPSESSPHDAAIQQAATAFGQCLTAGVQGLAETVTPEAGATTVLGGCSTEQRELEQAVEAMIATLPAEQQPSAREQLRTSLAEAETEVAAAIRQGRSAGESAQPAQ